MSRFGGPADSPGFLLWHVTLHWQRRMAAVLAPLGLTHVQFVLLASTWWLNTHGSEPTQQDVAVHAGTEIRMTSEVLRTLERKSLLVRAPHATDARARALRVTDAGASLARRAVEAVEGEDAAFFGAHATPAFLHTLRELS